MPMNKAAMGAYPTIARPANLHAVSWFANRFRVLAGGRTGKKTRFWYPEATKSGLQASRLDGIRS